MAATLLQSPVGSAAFPLYKAISTDERPRPTGDDATLYELDTKRVFVWHQGAWLLMFDHGAKPGATDALLGQIVSELQAIRSGIEACLGCPLTQGD